MKPISFKRRRFPADVIRQAVWLSSHDHVLIPAFFPASRETPPNPTTAETAAVRWPDLARNRRDFPTPTEVWAEIGGAFPWFAAASE